MKPTRRQGMLFAALILLALACIYSTWSRREADARRLAQHRQTLDNQSKELHKQFQLEEQARVARGEVWTGELHRPLDPLPLESMPPAASYGYMLNQRRIARSLELPGLNLSVSTELHECNPAADVCTTGGSIQVHLGSHFVCAVSLGLLRLPAPGVPSSHYRIEWQDHADGRPLTLQEKIEIVQSLARGGRPASADEFQRLMEIAYEHGASQAGGDEQEEHLRTLIATVFSTIAASREG